jgi:hypothetical protein
VRPANNKVDGSVRTNAYFSLAGKSAVEGDAYLVGAKKPKAFLMQDSSITGCLYAPLKGEIRTSNAAGNTIAGNTAAIGKTISIGGLCCYDGSGCKARSCLANSAIQVGAKQCPFFMPSIKKEINLANPVPANTIVEFKITVEDKLDLIGGKFIVEDVLPPQIDYIAHSPATGPGYGYDAKKHAVKWEYDDTIGGKSVFRITARVRCTAINTAHLTGRIGEGAGSTAVDLSTPPLKVESQGSCGAFNAVEPGQGGDGRIYMKLAGEAFKLDIVSLLSEASTGLASHQGKLDVRIFEASNAKECPKDPKPLHERKGLDFSDGNGGPVDRISLSGISVASPVQIAKVWIKAESSEQPFCSSDTFTVRPKTMALSAKNAAGSLMNQDHRNGTPFDHAGAPFFIEAKDPAYSIGNLNENAAIKGNYGTDVDPPLPPSCSFKANEKRVKCTYSDVGLLKFPQGAFDDAGEYTRNSGSGDMGKDCRQSNKNGQQWNDLDHSGQYGCAIPSKALVAGRWIPKSFYAKAAATSSCGTLAYIGEAGALALDFELEARDIHHNPTKLYNGGTPSLAVSPAQDSRGGQMSSRLKPTTPGAAWPAGLGIDAAAGLQTWQGGTWRFNPGKTVFVRRPAPEKDPPYAFTLALSLGEEDLSAIDIDAAADSTCTKSGTKLSCHNTPAVQLRLGRLAGKKTHGSQLLPLPVHFEAQYWDGKAWQRNALDNCTVLSLPQAGDCSKGLESTMLDGLLAATGKPQGSEPAKSGPAREGNFTLLLHLPADEGKGPGIPGDARLYLKPMIPRMDWLIDPAWPTGDACKQPARQPNVSICFGRCGLNQRFIHKRRLIAPSRP